MALHHQPKVVSIQPKCNTWLNNYCLTIVHTATCVQAGPEHLDVKSLHLRIESEEGLWFKEDAAT